MNRKLLISRFQQLSWIAVLIVIAMLVISAINKRQVSRSLMKMNVELFNVEGADSNLITKQEVEAILLNSFDYNILDSELKRIDVERAERVLEKNPFVKNVDVFIDNQNRINVKVIQRAPVVRVIDGEGRNYYMDAEANYMPLSEHYTARVLVMTGFIAPHEPNFMAENGRRHMLKNLFELSSMLRADPFFDKMIEQVHVSQNGDIVMIPKLGKQQILFGKYLNVEEKLQRLKIFYKEALPSEGWTRYELIDIRFKNQIVCTK